jgi:hypothetical protein
MTTVFAVVGSICAVLLLGSLLLGLFAAACAGVTTLHSHISWKAEAAARRDFGVRLVQESYWYSEDEAVMAALEIIGRKAMSSSEGYYNISECRAEWRERKGKSR